MKQILITGTEASERIYMTYEIKTAYDFKVEIAQMQKKLMMMPAGLILNKQLAAQNEKMRMILEGTAEREQGKAKK